MGSPAAPKEPFKVRAELLAASRLAPNVQSLYHKREQATQEIAHQCALLTLAAVRCYQQQTDETELPKVGIIGAGNVGCALTMALLELQYPAHRIVISTRQPDKIPKCAALARAAHAPTLFAEIERCQDNARVAHEAQILALCMPPSQLKSVAIQIKHALSSSGSTLLLSTLSGTSVSTLQKCCGCKLVLRTHTSTDDAALMPVSNDAIQLSAAKKLGRGLSRNCLFASLTVGCCIAHSTEAVDVMETLFMELCARLVLPQGHALWLSESDSMEQLPVAWQQALRLLRSACIHRRQ